MTGGKREVRIVGVDIGGTFTDLVLLDQKSGAVSIEKVSSTPSDPSQGLITGLEVLNVPFEDLDLVIHGTTVATNAILERKGGTCGLIATKGFRDVLELRRRDRPHLYGLTGSYEPLIPRDRRLEVDERISAQGDVLVPLSEDEVVSAGERLVAAGVEGIVVAFLNSYANVAHEREAKAILERQWPDIYVVASSEILPVFREFERTSTAVVNAYVQPVVSRYLAHLEDRLSSSGYCRDLLIVQSNGGMLSSRAARNLAVGTILSGPAGGVIAATRIAAESGTRNLIAYDMGGTSLDVSLVLDGEPSTSNGTELDFGVPVMLSMIDIHTLGAGGGSVAAVDPGGILQVGPRSAGAEPGPVCYGRGGTEPTLTDAHVVLGRINPDAPIAHRRSLDVDASRSAIGEHVGQPLGLSIEAAAEAILAVANNRIAGAIRRVSIDRGHDPRDFALFAFGGGGPLMISFLMRELGVDRGIVPVYPGIASAWGCSISNLRRDLVSMVNRRLSDFDTSDLKTRFEAHEEEGMAFVKGEGLALERLVVQHEADLSYEGQTHVIRTPLPSGDLTSEVVEEHFKKAYLRYYGHDEAGFGGLETLLDEIPIIVLNLRTSVIGIRPDIVLKNLIPRPSTSLQDAHLGQRSVYVKDEYLSVPTYARMRLPWGTDLKGPAVLEQSDATVWLDHGISAQVDDGGNLIVSSDQQVDGCVPSLDLMTPDRKPSE